MYKIFYHLYLSGFFPELLDDFFFYISITVKRLLISVYFMNWRMRTFHFIALIQGLNLVKLCDILVGRGDCSLKRTKRFK